MKRQVLLIALLSIGFAESRPTLAQEVELKAEDLVIACKVLSGMTHNAALRGERMNVVVFTASYNLMKAQLPNEVEAIMCNRYFDQVIEDNAQGMSAVSVFLDRPPEQLLGWTHKEVRDANKLVRSGITISTILDPSRFMLAPPGQKGKPH